MRVLMIIQLFAQIFLKGALNNLWSLLFTLQLCCFLKIYDIPTPSNAEIYMSQYTSLIKFEVLKPQGLVRLVYDTKFDMKVWIQGQKKLLSDPDELVSSFYDLLLYIILAGLSVVFLVAMVILKRSLPPKYKKMVADKLKASLDKFFWNGAIRSVYISYIDVAINCGLQMGMLLKASKYQKDSEKATGLAMLLYLVSAAVFWVVFIKKNLKKFSDKVFASKYDNFTNDVRLTESAAPTGKYFYAVFMVRRLVFVFIPVIFVSFSWLQLQLLLVVNTFYVCWYLHTKPLASKSGAYIRLFNEIMLMLVQYHLILFSSFITNPEAKFLYAYTFVGIIGLMIVVNITFVIIEEVKVNRPKAKAKKELKRRMSLRLEKSQSMNGKEKGLSDDDSKIEKLPLKSLRKPRVQSMLQKRLERQKARRAKSARIEEAKLRTIHEEDVSSDSVDQEVEEVVEEVKEMVENVRTPERRPTNKTRASDKVSLGIFEDSEDDDIHELPLQKPAPKIANPQVKSLAEKLRIARLKKSVRDAKKLKKA